MNLKLRTMLADNSFIRSVYKFSTDATFRKLCFDYGRRGLILNFQTLGEENPSDNIYFIRIGDCSQGMFSLITWTLRRLEVAEKFHLIPVVEWSKVIPYALEGQGNPFLMFFQPVSDISVESALKSASVAFSNNFDWAYGFPRFAYSVNQEEIDRLARVYRKYIKLQPELQKKIDRDVSELLGQAQGKVLGVHVRGVDWRNQKIYAHPIAPMEEEYLTKAKEMVHDLGYEKIFLASDSEGTIEMFRAEFGDCLITTQAVRAPAGSDALAIFDEKNDGYQMGYEVLRDTYALSACDSLLCGVSYVSYGARIIRQAQELHYERIVVFDKGMVKNGPSAGAVSKKERKSLRKK